MVSFSEKDLNLVKIVRFSKLANAGIKNYQLGNHIAAFHLFDNSLIYMTSDEYLDPVIIPQTCCVKNVVSYSCNHLHLIYLLTNGEVKIIFYDPLLKTQNFKENNFNINFPAISICSSYNFCIIVSEKNKSGVFFF